MDPTTTTSTTTKQVKAVKFGYQPTPQTRELLTVFRDMVNDAIRICLEERIKGRLKLRARIYKEFQRKYGVVSCFPSSVAEVAWSSSRSTRDGTGGHTQED
jgi:hypothetical protein